MPCPLAAQGAGAELSGMWTLLSPITLLRRGTQRSGIGAHPDHVSMDFLSSGGRVADGDVNSKSFECREMKRRQHWVARTRLTSGLSSSVCAHGHTVNVAPRTGLVTKELAEPEEGVPLQQVSIRPFGPRSPRLLQLGETQLNVWFHKKR